MTLPTQVAEDRQNANRAADAITATVARMRTEAQKRTATNLVNGIGATSLDALMRATTALHADFSAHTNTLTRLKTTPRKNWIARLFSSRGNEVKALQEYSERLEGSLVVVREALRVRSSDLEDAQQAVARDIAVLEALTKSVNTHAAHAAADRLPQIERAYAASQTNDIPAINWWRENIDSLLRSVREARATGGILDALTGVETVLHERDRQFGEKRTA